MLVYCENFSSEEPVGAHFYYHSDVLPAQQHIEKVKHLFQEHLTKNIQVFPLVFLQHATSADARIIGYIAISSNTNTNLAL